MRDLNSARRIVVKTGSALVADRETGQARHDWISCLAEDLCGLRRAGKDVVLVSSGAVALGQNSLGLERPVKLEQKQAAAAIGQPRLMAALARGFDANGIQIAQALLTLDDTERRRRWLNARATFEALFESGALPIVNENDTVATDEIRFGDNDRLAARVAQMIGADLLILLSDVDGLYSDDPRRSPDAVHVPEVEAIDETIEAMAGDANLGSGGMATKIAAARIAWAAGCATVIARGDTPNPVHAIRAGAKATWFRPPETPESARRIWLGGHLTPEGTLIVDHGAAKAIQEGASLLPVGVIAIEGRFERGAAVQIKDTTGKAIGKGVCAYDSDAVDRIKGLRTEDAEALLGYRGRPALIHRNDLVLEHFE